MASSLISGGLELNGHLSKLTQYGFFYGFPEDIPMMHGAIPALTDMMASQVDACADFDMVDELLLEGDWLDDPDNLLFDASDFSNPAEIGNSNFKSENICKGKPNGEERSDLSLDSSSSAMQTGEVAGNQSFESSEELTGFALRTCEYGSYGASGSKNTVASSLRERLNRVVKYIEESQKETDILVQIWIPVRRRDRQVLTTYGQPFRLDPNCRRLVEYRTVSTNYCFAAEGASGEALGMPGRVFVGRVPEWTPDVRFFSSYEYPRVNYAQRVDVRGSLALPVFDRHSKSCLGVVEVVMTTEKINYSSDIENICKALQAVDLGSSEVLSVPRIKVRNECYLAVIPEIKEVLRVACQMHKLPLAQTWIPCAQQGKRGSHHIIGYYEKCVSTVDVACHVNDPTVLGFHEACSEHHLFKGQGVAGRAFTTNQPCFSHDTTAFSNTEYPLAHCARMFKLGGAVAIRLRSSHTGTADFVLEFFLPNDCVVAKEQKQMLHSLSSTIQQVSWSLRVVTAKELQGEVVFHDSSLTTMPSLLEHQEFEESHNSNREEMLTVFEQEVPKEEPSWNFGILEVQEKHKGKVQPGVIQFDERINPQHGATAHLENMVVNSQRGGIFSELNKSQQTLVRDTEACPKTMTTEVKISKPSKATERRHTKNEKSISLQILQQYFAGSLKDAAKSLGVCPTTLKRICRQHGITRWPSRKIKKVGHSLRKLQVVIDSVHGAEHAFPLNSFYTDFSKPLHSETSTQSIPTNSTISKFVEENQPESNRQQALYSFHASTSNSQSSCGQSSGSNEYSTTGAKQFNITPLVVAKSEEFMEEDNNNMLKSINDEVELPPLTPKSSNPVSTHSPASVISKHTHSESLSFPCQDFQSEDLLRIKVVLGEETLRFKLPSTCGYQDLKDKIAKRFDINASSMYLKYLDDDSEWILLTCDDDLRECIEVYKSSGNRTIKLSVHPVRNSTIILS